ncbi:MAG: winged helix-turn-helix domain-containing protein [Bryobacteraceae bacterium]|jgi:DNA-binding response OmpR family regulator
MPYLELQQSRPQDGYRDAHVELDYRRTALTVDARPVKLTRKEYELFALLARNAGEIVPREVLLLRVWGYGQGIRTRTLDVHIRRLRKKLGAYGDRYIETIFGVGYRFQPYREARPFSLYGDAIAVA